jgi:hypothetical protein
MPVGDVSLRRRESPTRATCAATQMSVRGQPGGSNERISGSPSSKIKPVSIHNPSSDTSDAASVTPPSQ